MTVTAFRIALGASILALSAGAALSQQSPASASVKCTAPQAQAANRVLYQASTTARHTNVMRVRYTADHAMPPARPANTVAQASCTPLIKTGSASLN